MEDVEHLRATERELKKYAEEDEEDYDDVFAGAVPSERKNRKHAETVYSRYELIFAFIFKSLSRRLMKS
jgi:hypothetical protein